MPNLHDMAKALNEAGIKAEVGNTGGNCMAVIVPLIDNDEVLITDYEISPDADLDVDGWCVGFYPLDAERVDIFERPDPDCMQEVVDVILSKFDDMYEVAK